MTTFPQSPLTQQLQELFIDSTLSPQVTTLLVESLDAVFVEHTIYRSSNLKKVIQKLYAINDQEMYVIISICNVNEYQAVLLPLLKPLIKKAAIPVVKHLRESGLYSGVTLYEEVKKLNVLTATVFDVLTDSTKTKRRAVKDVGASKTVIFPDYEVLKEFYECGRKKAYTSVENVGMNLHQENSLYFCMHCKHYHQGRPRLANAPVVPQTMVLSRYQTAWRRYHKI